MKDIINNFIFLRAQNAEDLIVWILIGIYAALLLASLLSIFSSKRRRIFKFSWALVIFVLPILGMTMYSLFCLWTADRSFLAQLGVGKKGAGLGKAVTRASPVNHPGRHWGA